MSSKSLIKLFSGLITFIFIFFSFSFAATTTANPNVSAGISSFLNEISRLLSYLYLLFWPLLALGGKFLSNKFVYGPAFGIDNILWRLWQFIRTGMNYFLGILLIVSILIYLVKDNSKLSIKILAPKLIIAAVVVNLSWFIMAVLIDISSVLILVSSDFANEFNKTLVSKTDLAKKNIMVPVVVNINSQTGFVAIKGNNGQDYYQCIYDKNNKIKNAPCFYIKNGDYKIVDKDGNEIPNAMTALKSKDLEENTGLLFSLFRYLNTSFLVDNTNSFQANLILSIMKILIWIILLIPFILLVIILFVRVLVLWIAIPLSPVLFGLTILGIGDSYIKEKFNNILAIIFQPAYVMVMLSLGFIFIQAVYMMYPRNSQDNLLKKFGFKKESSKDIPQKSKDTNKPVTYHIEIYSYKNMFNISSEYKKEDGTNSLNIDYKNIFSFFSWVIVNLFSAFVLWTLVFAALKSGKITRGLVTSVETYTKQVAKTYPILPAGQSVASLGQAVSHLNNVPDQLVTKSSNQFRGEIEKFGKELNNKSKK